MKFFKLYNIKTLTGSIDYKGMNIDMFVPGTQKYPAELDYCVVGTEEDFIPSSSDVVELSEADYALEHNMIASEVILSPEQKEIETLKLMVADLALNSGGL